MPRLTHVLVAIAMAIPSAAYAGDLRRGDIVVTNPTPSVTEGQITVNASPDAAYAAFVDYAHWPQIFTYIGQVTIKSQHGDRAEIITRTKDGKRNRLRFRNDRAHHIVRFDDLRAHADISVEVSFTKGQTPGSTIVRVRVSTDVEGVAGLLVSDVHLRRMREEKIVKDLTLVRAYLNARGQTVARHPASS